MYSDCHKTTALLGMQRLNPFAHPSVADKKHCGNEAYPCGSGKTGTDSSI
ncbi:MAG: hypothetical protein GX781_06605 [Clostridiales bacterium]|nr:hypothetical protein [Clostridiales bacterium]